MNKNDFEKALDVIKKGGVVVCPTDTVYGLIADATNKKAVEKIFKIKKRPRSKPLAVFVSGIKQAKELAQISKEQEKILKKRWPGKYTFVLKSRTSLKLLTKNGTIALRVPKYKFLIDLIKKINRPLAQTSANISGQPASTKIGEVLKQFGYNYSHGRIRIPRGRRPRVALFVCGDLPKNKPSAIINLTKDKAKILRK